MRAGTLIAQLRASGETLAGAYPYAAWLGGHLYAQQPTWAERFRYEDPEGAALPLPQARDYRFLTFVEIQPGWLAEADRLLAEHLDTVGGGLLAELENTALWFCDQEP